LRPRSSLSFGFVGARHNIPFTGFGPPGTPLAVQAMALRKGTVDLWDRYLKHDTAAQQRLVADLNVPGVVTPFPPAPALAPGKLTKCRRGPAVP
jgi:hypothetical protein